MPDLMTFAITLTSCVAFFIDSLYLLKPIKFITNILLYAVTFYI